MATITRYVDTDVIGGLGDGTSWANAYSSMNAWNAAEQTDLVTDGDTHVCYCRASSDTADTTAVNVNGWTTDSTHFITIEVGSDDRHTATGGTGYRIELSTGSSIALNISEAYTVVDGVSCYADGNAGFFIGTNDCTIINCLSFDCGVHGFYNNNNTGNGFVNCGALNTTQHGFYCRRTCFCYNCTSVNSTTNGFQIDTFRTLTGKNCYAGGSTTSDYAGAGTLTLTTCGSEDLTGTTTGITLATGSGTYFVNVTSGSEDVNINNASSSLIDVGTDLSGDGTYSFSTDYEEESRSGTWDLGIDEYVSAVTGNPWYFYAQQ